MRSPFLKGDRVIGLSVDERFGAQRQVFDFDADGGDVNGGVALADLWVFEEVDLAVGGAADVSWVAIKNELLAGDDAGGDFKPAGFGGIFDEAGAQGARPPIASSAIRRRVLFDAGAAEDRDKERAANQSSHQSAGHSDEQALEVPDDQT